MKIFKLFFAIFIIIIIFCIYNTTKDTKLYYGVIGDYISSRSNGFQSMLRNKIKKDKKLENYNNDFVEDDYHINDLIYILKNNNEKNGKTIKNILIKADILTLSIGMNDLIYKLNLLDGSVDKKDLELYVDQMMIDIDELLNIIRINCKEKIIIIGYYLPGNYNNEYSEIIDYANKKLLRLTKLYNMEYVDISVFNKEDKYLNSNNIYINKLGHKYIYNKLKNIVKK